jgi:uncharacterized membrane protein
MTELSNDDNKALRAALSSTLAVGVIISLALMLVAVVMAVLQPDRLSNQVMPLNELPAALIEGSPMAFFGLGILVLLVTPPMRELVLLIGYARQRRWHFVIIAVVVLVILGLSVFLSLTR